MITSYNETGSTIEDVIVEAMFSTETYPNNTDGTLIKQNLGTLTNGFFKLVPGRRNSSMINLSGLSQGSGTECTATVTPLSYNVSAIESGSFYFPVVLNGKQTNTTLTFDYSENPSFTCSGANDGNYVVYEHLNDFDNGNMIDSNLGVRKTFKELRDFSTYCNTPVSNGNRQLVCDNDAVHFGIIYEDISRDIGTDIVLELFKGDLTGEELAEDFRFPWIYEATRGETPDLTFRR